MSTEFLIYFVMQLDSINTVLKFFVAMTFLVTGGAITFNVVAWSGAKLEEGATDKDKEILDSISRIRKKAVVVFITIVFITALMPTTKTAIYMIGGSATIEALQSPEAKEIGGKALELLQKKLDEELSK